MTAMPMASSRARDANDGRRATPYTSGREHSPHAATGSAWERAPRRAVPVVAWEAPRRHGA